MDSQKDVEYEMNLSSIDTTNLSQGANCSYTELSNFDVKVPLLMIITPVLCFVGILGNGLSIVVFLQRNMRCMHANWLAGLAFFDTGVLITAVMLYSVEVAYDYFKNVNLYIAWLRYLKLVYFLSHFFQTGAIYMTIAATIERFLATVCRNNRVAAVFCADQNVTIHFTVAFVFLLLLNGSKYFEIDVIERPFCFGFERFRIKPSAIMGNYNYAVVYSLWISNLLVIFLPFVLLLVLNVFIILRMKKDYKRDSNGVYKMVKLARSKRSINNSRKSSISHLRARRRGASLILSLVVGLFLICNTPGFLLTLTEQVDYSFLMAHPVFYGFCKDTINILTIFNSTANVFLYFFFSENFRINVFCIFRCQENCLDDENMDENENDITFTTSDHQKISIFLLDSWNNFEHKRHSLHSTFCRYNSSSDPFRRNSQCAFGCTCKVKLLNGGPQRRASHTTTTLTENGTLPTCRSLSICVANSDNTSQDNTILCDCEHFV